MELLNVPNKLVPQVQALMRKEEKRKHDKDMMKAIPYWDIIITGEKDSNGHENLDKIKFPALVTYSSLGDKRKGFITRDEDGYYLWDCTQQWDFNYQGTVYGTIQELWEEWNFKVLKAKIIGKQG